MGIYTKTAAGWEELGVSGTPGELPGLGGWAEITSVTGSPKRYAYNDGPGGVGGMDWVAFEWTADGSVTTQAGGLVDCFLISGGGGYFTGPNATNIRGGGGRITHGLEIIAESNAITIGTGGPKNSNQDTCSGKPTVLGDTSTGMGPLNVAAGPGPDASTGWVSDITGVDEEYGRVNSAGPRANKGDGGYPMSPGVGSDGCCIVRVPAAQAAGVDPGSWVTRTAHYAAVDAGVVTDVFDAHDYGDGTVTPLPKTDLVECDQSVQVGWLFDGDSFMEPEPPAPSVFRFDFTKEYSVAGGANHWPMALRVNKTDLDGAEIDLTGWGQARLQFDGKDMTVTVTQIEESSTYWRFTFAEFVNEFDSRLSCEIEISQPAPVRAVESEVKTAVKSRRKKK